MKHKNCFLHPDHLLLLSWDPRNHGEVWTNLTVALDVLLTYDVSDDVSYLMRVLLSLFCKQVFVFSFQLEFPLT